MHSLSLLALGLVTVGAYAKSTIRAPGELEVFLSTAADKVASVSEIRVVATVKNVGDEDLKVLKSGTVLDNQHPTRSFIVTKDGKDVPFIGIKVFLSMDHLSENDSVVIPAGGNVTAEHDVSAVYDFFATGPGTFTFGPVPRFQIVGLNHIIETNTARPVSITVTDVSKRGPNLEGRILVDCSDEHKRYVIGFSYLEARAMARIASMYISSRGEGDRVYQAYFGSSPVPHVVANFDAIVNENDPHGTLSCADPLHKCGGPTAAYTDLSATMKKIYYCDIFYGFVTHDRLCKGLNANAPNLLASATLHQLSHAVVHTDDIASGCPASLGLAAGNGGIDNAESYSCFAAQVYQDTKC